ncbi:hypothetical protein HS125_03310 [bacterium]|nr:hypothetical protein [bacterium]
MRHALALPLILIAFIHPALGAARDLEVEIWNETTGAPGLADQFNVLTMGRDVEYLLSRENVAGAITVPSLELDQPHLLQAIVGGVKYNRMLMPGAPLAEPLRVSVYDATQSPLIVHAHDFRVLFGHDNAVQHVMLAATLVNDGSYTYFSEGPTWVLAVPETARSSLKVELNRDGVPVPLTPEPAGEGRVGLSFAVQPGHTNLEISYEGEPYTGRAELLLDFPFVARSLTLLTLPDDIRVLAPSAEDRGIVEEDHLHIYGVSAELPGRLAFAFEGGRFPARAESGGHEGEVKNTPNLWAGFRGLVLLGVLLALLFLFGVWDLFRREEPGGALNLSPAECRALEERLSAELAELEARHARREVSEIVYRDRKRRLTSQLALLSDPSRGAA